MNNLHSRINRPRKSVNGAKIVVAAQHEIMNIIFNSPYFDVYLFFLNIIKKNKSICSGNINYKST